MSGVARYRLLCAATIVAGALAFAAPTSARADALLYRCGPNVCRAAPDGSGKEQLTSDGRAGRAARLQRLKSDNDLPLDEGVACRARRLKLLSFDR